MNSLVKNSVVTALAAALAIGVVSAQAHEAGDILVRGRIVNVNPNDDSSSITVNGADTGVGVEVDDGTTLDVDFTYMYTENVAFELLLDFTSKHEISTSLAGLGTIAEVNTLPPSLFAQYHFSPSGAVQPYVGLGVNYTTFLSEDTSGGLSSYDIEVDDSFGLGAQAGADIAINDDWFFNVDVKVIDIDTDATLYDSATATTIAVDVDIDPVIFGVGVGTRF